MKTRRFGLSTALVALILTGCGGAATLLAYVGGGLPPGDDDIGGVVLAAVDTAGVSTAQAADGPVPGCEVILTLGSHEVGRTVTGPEGYFRFEKPATGNYAVDVTPPAGSGLAQVRRQFQHRKGRQTFLTIELEAAP
jgi:hypothetical protein